MTIRRNLETVRSEVERACAKAGRSADSVTIVAVTKTFPVEFLEAAAEEGLRHFGENRVQEASMKLPRLRRSDLVFHMVGTLQTNKVKDAVALFHFIESLDRPGLAAEIAKRADPARKPVLLLQINASRERTKHGLPPGEAEGFLRWLSEAHPGLEVSGLMTIGPFTPNPEDSRPAFREVTRLAAELAKKKIQGVTMRYLSMGMSGDYPVAIEEGSNMIRLGTAIFGRRPPGKDFQ